MAAKHKFYWFGLSVSTLGSTENRTDETQSIGDLVTQECKSMTATQKQGCLETVELKTLLLILDKKCLNGTKCEK